MLSATPTIAGKLRVETNPRALSLGIGEREEEVIAIAIEALKSLVSLDERRVNGEQSPNEGQL
jgi:hypothetical protein